MPDKYQTVYSLIVEACGDVELSLESYNVPFLREAHRDLQKAIEAIHNGATLETVVK